MILGIFLSAILLEAGLRIGGAVFFFFQESQNQRSLRTHGYRIMCLGESTTAGAYPHFLEEELNRRGQGIKFSVIDKGMPSVNTDVILAQLESNLDRYKPDLVVTMMGINDQGEHLPPEPRNTSGVARWFLSLRVVKLVRFIELHWAEKIKKPREIKPLAAKIPPTQESSVELSHEKLKNFGLTDSQELLDLSGSVQSRETEIISLREAWKALSDGDHQQADRLFQEVLEKNPRNAQAYYGLSWSQRPYEFERQELFLLKVIELMPHSPLGYQALGDMYLTEKRYAMAEDAFKKAKSLHYQAGHVEQMENIVFSLVHIYMIQKRYSEAEQTMKEYLAIAPESDRCYRRLRLFYHEMGRSEEPGDFEQRKISSDKDFCNRLTVGNYRRLKEILDQRKIRLVCAQYPMRNISVLQEIFASQEGVFFVDNEETFKAAVAGGRLHEYFGDMFGGDFGHCTDLGNKLLAKQIANVILNEVLGMKQVADY